MDLFATLEKINDRPQPFEFYTAADLWTDDHISAEMLRLHLDTTADPASRNQAFIDRSLWWIIERFAVSADTRICDFGCGPGLYTAPLAEHGAVVTGIDFSRRSIDFARQAAKEKKLAIEYIHQNYLEYAGDGTFDLITMIYCDFCALAPDQRKILLRILRDSLAGDGLILLDVFTEAFFDGQNEKRSYELVEKGGFWSPEPHFIFANTHLYEPEKIYLDKYTIYEKGRSREIYNWLQCYSLESLRAELETNGLHIREVYANVAGDPFDATANEMAVVIGKQW